MNALNFARQAHEGQYRKYNGSPYIVHPASVALRLAMAGVTDDVVLNAAYLHDVIEDTKFTYEDIEKEFGKEVADVVQEVTSPSATMCKETYTRYERKKADRDHLATVSNRAKLIKVADCIDNLTDLCEPGPTLDFLILYVGEKEALANVLTGVNQALEMELEGALDNVKTVIQHEVERRQLIWKEETK